MEEPPPASATRRTRERYDQLVREAKAVCASCPLFTDCLFSAVAEHDVSGFVAGTTAAQRRSMRNLLDVEVQADDFDQLAGARGYAPPGQPRRGTAAAHAVPQRQPGIACHAARMLAVDCQAPPAQGPSRPEPGHQDAAAAPGGERRPGRVRRRGGPPSRRQPRPAAPASPDPILGPPADCRSPAAKARNPCTSRGSGPFGCSVQASPLSSYSIQGRKACRSEPAVEYGGDAVVGDRLGHLVGGRLHLVRAPNPSRSRARRT